MKGYFSEETLKQFAQLAGEEFGTNFSEGDTYDFTRCVRPDGSFYGTSGECRKGSKTGAKEQTKKAPPIKADKKVKESTPAQTPTDDRAKKVEALKKAREEYTKHLKKQMEYVAKGDMANAEKTGVKVKAAVQKIKIAEAAAMTPEQKAALGKEVRQRAEWDKAQRLRDQKQEQTKLTAKEKKALKDYTGEAENGVRNFKDVNSCMRSPQCKDKGSKQFADELDQVIKKLPSNTEGDAFYRGVDARSGSAQALYKTLENAKPGTTLSDPGFGSYSSRQGVTNNFLSGGKEDKNIVFVSRNRSLTPINKFSEMSDEYEALLPRNTSQTIRSVRKEGGTLFVELD
jgi:hypothetical protein